ncbi:MAG: glycoside hydrolase domain-containing protein, partial [Solirubrobacterales bacterium]
MRFQGLRVRRARALLLGVLGALAVLTMWQGALATSGAGARTIEFAGRAVEAPASWPVFRLSEHPRMCVRLDRRAVYLGTPAPNQRCPAEAVGRRRAILVDPAAAARASSLPTLPRRVARAGGAIFTGLGFDACTAPSSRTMSAWALSPYRAVGVYIGGLNRACSQPNLTSSWVTAQTAAGWHLIPTYVGLQAPTSSCTSCAKLTATQASAQGTAAAVD